MRVLLFITALAVPAAADDPLPVDGDPLPPCYYEWSASTAERLAIDPLTTDPCGAWDTEYWDGADLCVYWCGSDLIETVIVEVAQ